MTDVELQEGDRVSLKGECSDLYKFAPAGSEGWIRLIKEDKFGFPMAYIEWDKSHWAYNGEPDGWTFQAHFTKVESKEESMKDFDKQEFINHLSRFFDDREAEEKSQAAQEAPNNKRRQEISKVLQDALASLDNTEGIFLVAAKREQLHENVDVIIPDAFFIAPNGEAKLLIQAYLAQFVAAAFEKLAVDQLGNKNEPRR